MGTSKSIAIATALDMRDRGLLPEHIGPNALVIREEGVRLVRGRIPRDVRKELMTAVKAGKLGHLKKEQFKPEAFFHPNSKERAMRERSEAFNEAIANLKKVCVSDLEHRVTQEFPE